MKPKGARVDEQIHVCTKHFIEVGHDGLCKKCVPDMDKYTDKDYEKARNALIPEARQIANRRVKDLIYRAKKMGKTIEDFELRPGADGRPYKHFWSNEAYSKAMTELVEKHNLREAK